MSGDWVARLRQVDTGCMLRNTTPVLTVEPTCGQLHHPLDVPRHVLGNRPAERIGAQGPAWQTKADSLGSQGGVAACVHPDKQLRKAGGRGTGGNWHGCRERAGADGDHALFGQPQQGLVKAEGTQAGSRQGCGSVDALLTGKAIERRRSVAKRKEFSFRHPLSGRRMMRPSKRGAP